MLLLGKRKRKSDRNYENLKLQNDKRKEWSSIWRREKVTDMTYDFS